MRHFRAAAIGILVATFSALPGCSTSPPLADNLMFVPVSDEADVSAGLDVSYVSGVNQGFFNYVACDNGQTCWYSGNLALLNKNESRVNPLVVRAAADGRIVWARSYQLNGRDAMTLGMLPTSDGGSLLYGNAIVGEPGLSRGRLRPLYERLDAQGIPQWGGTMLLGQLQPWSAFSDAIPMSEGGYALTGSGYFDGVWHGAITRLAVTGKPAWTAVFNSRGESTLSSFLTQLRNGHVLAAGYNEKLQDLVVFDFAPDGKLTAAPIFHIRGDEFPIGFVLLADGPAVVAVQHMPSGEYASLLIQLNSDGKFENAVRYRYADGFKALDVIALPNHRMCLYGLTEAKDNELSLAFTVGADKKPSSAVALTGDFAFASGARFGAETLIFVGGRQLGANQHGTAMVTKWWPAIKNERSVLRKLSEEPAVVKIYKDESAKEWSDEREIMTVLPLSSLQNRLVSGQPSATMDRKP